MVQAYNNNIQVSTNTVIPFAKTQLKTGCVATVSSDGTTIYLNRPGIYKIELDATGVPAADGTVSIQLTLDGSNITSATSSSYQSAGFATEVGINTLVAVDKICSCLGGKKIQAVYTGAAGTLNTVNIIVTKIR